MMIGDDKDLYIHRYIDKANGKDTTSLPKVVHDGLFNQMKEKQFRWATLFDSFTY